MWHELQLFLIALHAGTRLPLPAWAAGQPDWRARSARHDPAVGLIVGAFGAIALFAGALVWPASVCVLLSVGAMVWFTRAAGEAGLARCCDTWASDARRPAHAAVTQASGLAGLLGLLLLIGLRALAIHGLATRDLALTLAAMPLAQAWSRAASMAWLHLQPAAAGGPTLPAERQPPPVDGLGFAVALMWTMVAGAGAAMTVPGRALAEAALTGLLVLVGLAWALRRRFGPLDADALAAFRQGVEVAILLGLLASLAHG